MCRPEQVIKRLKTTRTHPPNLEAVRGVSDSVSV